MTFELKKTKKKVCTGYKTLYLSQVLIDQIDAMASKNHTSFNNIVVSMIEHCLEEDEQPEKQ